MSNLPVNSLEDQLAKYAANRKNRGFDSTRKINGQYTFKKVSSLDSLTAQRELQPLGNNCVQVPRKFSHDFISSTVISSKDENKSVGHPKKQQTITNLFARNTQKSKENVITRISGSDTKARFSHTDDCDAVFDDLSDFDIPSSTISCSIVKKDVPKKKQGSDDRICKDTVTLSQFSEIPLSEISPIDNFDDDDDAIEYSRKKKKNIILSSDDDSDATNITDQVKDKFVLEGHSHNKQSTPLDVKRVNYVNEVDDVLCEAEDFLNKHNVKDSRSSSFSNFPYPVIVGNVKSSSSSSTASMLVRKPSPLHYVKKDIKEISSSPLLHRNNFLDNDMQTLESTLFSLEEMNFSVMTNICSVIEEDPSILKRSESLSSLIEVRSKILKQHSVVENAVRYRQSTPVTKTALTPAKSRLKDNIRSRRLLKDCPSIANGESTRLSTGSSFIHSKAISSNSFSNSSLSGQCNEHTSPASDQCELGSFINNSSDNSVIHENDVIATSSEMMNLEACLEDFGDDVFDIDGEIDAQEGVQTVIHNIYGKGEDASFTNSQLNLPERIIAGRFYGNYRDDGSSAQFKGTNFQHSKNMLDVFRNVFGLQAFRHNQLEAINAAMLNEDCFILMPTGGGKSLCYQLPALLTTGVTIVVSPLRSLIMDQVQKLWSLDVPANCLSGDIDTSAANTIYRQLASRDPTIKLIYVTPEKICASNKLISTLESLYARKMLARFVIDEAHCVSQWGHDFRPDYKRLKILREKFPEVPMIALTATATPRVRVDILHQLGMSSPKWFLQSFNRPNLKYEIKLKKGKTVVQDVIDLIKSKFKNMSGIVYCLSRNDCDNVAAELSRNSIKAVSYHAGLDNRNQVQESWINDQFKVVCATIAFGMGIDKPDVRFVIHHTIPKSIEGYYQESGRAGRDGELSWCILYYNYQDMHRIKRMVQKDDTNKQMWQTHFNNLYKMVHFCENKTDCRRVQMLEYFGEVFDKQLCSKVKKAVCDNCFSKDAFERCDVTEDAKAIVKCVSEIVGKNRWKNYTLLYLTDIFKGSKTQKIIAAGHDKIPLHGRGSKYSRSDAERLLRKLVLDQYLQENLIINQLDLPNAYVFLGKQASELLQGKVKVIFFMKKDSKNLNSLNVVPEEEDIEMKQLTERCYNELVEVSKEIAIERNMHYTNIINIEALRQMSRQMPLTEEEMLCIPHITRAIYDKYGSRFLDVTQKYGAERCVIEAERADKHMMSEIMKENNQEWSNEPTPLRKGNVTYRKRKKTTKGPAAKRPTNAKYFQGKNTKGKWKRPKAGRYSKSVSSISSENTNYIRNTGKNFSVANTSRNTSNSSMRTPGFLPAPRPKAKAIEFRSARSFMPPPKLSSF